MAKAGFYLYGASGKVGNLVARKSRKGGTTLAERVFNIKNPQTNRQMAQRIILATVSQAVKFLSPIVDHSFQGVKIGADCKDRFRKLNMSRLRSLAAVDFEDASSPVNSTVFMTTKGIQALIPNSYVISTGSLSPSKLAIKVQDQGGVRSNFAVQFPNISINVQTEDDVSFVTLGDLLKAYFGITQVSEQLTFVAIQRAGADYQYAYDGDPTFPGFMIPYTSMKAVRLFVAPTVDLSQRITINAEDTDATLTSIQNAIVGAFADSPRTDIPLLNAIKDRLDAMDAELTVADGVLSIDNSDWAFSFTDYNMDDADGNGYVYALGLIRSRLNEDGSWLYSNTTMLLARPTNEIDTNFGLYWNGAIQAWFATNEVASNELYLRGGTKLNEIGESFT